LDLPNRDHVLGRFTPHSWHEANEEIVVCRERRVDEDIIYSREIVISKKEGLIRDARYCTRLYGPEKIQAMLRLAGFGEIKIRKDFVTHQEELDYGLMTNRMIAVGLTTQCNK
jgi:hypothetical protein